ncbi:MAG TPA: ankyrin repeat domain-containing protein [Actinocrinis sp.]|nr:ankyrin repeat domain-containing protein [Actinocrinis sp.]
MPTVPLPEQPSLAQIRKQARELQRRIRAAAPDALAEAAEFHPSGTPDEARRPAYPLSSAQLIVARRYGFARWARLKHHVDVVERYGRTPAALDQEPTATPADEFLRLACLTFEEDRPERRAEARRVLAEHPELTRASAHAAAATADVSALRALLAENPAAARTEGGPYRWEPLLYLAYARHDPAMAEAPVLDTARLLLGHGADPNAGYLWHGRYPFTALTGVFGEGERGPVDQPRHPHSLALARVLLEAGADPDDGQALYNRMFGRDDDHLELLFEFGLGTDAGGVWRARLGGSDSIVETPAQMVRGQLRWAIAHGMADRVRLLAEHGADIREPFHDGVTPGQYAATTGHPELVGLLVSLGADAPQLDPADAFIAAALAADRTETARLRADRPDLVAAARAKRPGLVVWAAAHGRPGSVELLVEAGFRVNAKARRDVPLNGRWETALHVAAMNGDPDLTRTLLALGADPDIRDKRFNATALGWARHFGQAEIAEILEPVTAPEPATEEDGATD